MERTVLAWEQPASWGSGPRHQHLLKHTVGTRVLLEGKKYLRPSLVKSQADTTEDRSDYFSCLFPTRSPCTQLPRNSPNVFIFFIPPCGKIMCFYRHVQRWAF